MKVLRIGQTRVAISGVSDLLSTHYAPAVVDFNKCQQVGPRLVSKAAQEKKILAAPYSMQKLLDLLDLDEYHAGCIEAIVNSALITVECKSPKVQEWLKAAEYPACESESTILGEFIKNYLACGNGFLLKMRNVQKQWVGLERMLPSEISIVENYDSYNFLRPNYIQTRSNKKQDFAYADVIHLKRNTHRSNAWGLACLPIAINIEILGEVKTFDYNNFKNGLMADYFMIVEGGTLRDGTVTDEEGNEVVTDAYTEIEKALLEAKGNSKSHSTVLIESESKDVKIRLEPLRQQDKDGGFITLKKDLREGIFAYHRTPPRIVSQLVSGQLGGDNNSDMILFYNFVIKPLQRRLAETLAQEFNFEFKWNVQPADFNFGKLTDEIQTTDERLFSSLRNA